MAEQVAAARWASAHERKGGPSMTTRAYRSESDLRRMPKALPARGGEELSPLDARESMSRLGKGVCWAA